MQASTLANDGTLVLIARRGSYCASNVWRDGNCDGSSMPVSRGHRNGLLWRGRSKPLASQHRSAIRGYIVLRWRFMLIARVGYLESAQLAANGPGRTYLLTYLSRELIVFSEISINKIGI